jgi:hypothetical protein
MDPLHSWNAYGTRDRPLFGQEQGIQIPSIPERTAAGNPSSTWRRAQEFGKIGVDVGEAATEADVGLSSRVLSGMSWVFNIFPHALARGADAAIKGASWGDQFSEIGRGLAESFYDPDTGHNTFEQWKHGEVQPTFVDLFKKQGIDGWRATVGGMALDLLTDPAMVVSFGAKLGPEAAAKVAGQTALRATPEVLSTASYSEKIIDTLGEAVGAMAKQVTKQGSERLAFRIAAGEPQTPELIEQVIGEVAQGLKLHPDHAGELFRGGIEAAQEAMNPAIRKGVDIATRPYARLQTLGYGSKAFGYELPGFHYAVPGSARVLEAIGAKAKAIMTTMPGLRYAYAFFEGKGGELHPAIRTMNASRSSMNESSMDTLLQEMGGLSPQSLQVLSPLANIRAIIRDRDLGAAIMRVEYGRMGPGAAKLPRIAEGMAALPQAGERLGTALEGEVAPEAAQAFAQNMGATLEPYEQAVAAAKQTWDWPVESAMAAAQGAVREKHPGMEELRQAAERLILRPSGRTLAVFKKEMMTEQMLEPFKETYRTLVGASNQLPPQDLGLLSKFLKGKPPTPERMEGVADYIIDLNKQRAAVENNPWWRVAKEGGGIGYEFKTKEDFIRHIFPSTTDETGKVLPGVTDQELKVITHALDHNAKAEAMAVIANKVGLSEEELPRMQRLLDIAWENSGLHFPPKAAYTGGTMAQRSAIREAAKKQGEFVVNEYGPNRAFFEKPSIYPSAIDARLAGFPAEENMLEVNLRRGFASNLRMTSQRMLTDIRQFGKAAESAPEGWKAVEPVTITGMGKIHSFREIADLKFEPQMADAIRNEIQHVYDSPSMNALWKMWDWGMGWWKGMATVMRPGFHVLNFTSNLYNSWLVGMSDPTRVPAALALSLEDAPRPWMNKMFGGPEKALAAQDKLKRFLVSASSNMTVGEDGKLLLHTPNGPLTSAQIRQMAQGEGISSGWFQAGMQDIAKAATQGPPTPLQQIGNELSMTGTASMGRHLGEWIENVSRDALFMDGLVKGYTPKAAGGRVISALFDYGDLNQAEQTIARRIMPFYVWRRRNLPFQVMTLAQNPKYHAGTLHALNAVQGMVAEKERVPADLQPFYFGDMYAVQTPWKDKSGNPMFLSYNLPFIDFNSMLSIRDWVSSFDPRIGLSVAALTNRDMGTGRPIENTYGRYQREIVAAPWWVGALTAGGKLPLLGDKVFPWTDPEDGVQKVGMYGSVKYAIERMVPPLANIDRLIGQTGARDRNAQNYPWLRFFSNVRLQSINVEQQKEKYVGRAKSYAIQKYAEAEQRGKVPPRKKPPISGLPPQAE